MLRYVLAALLVVLAAPALAQNDPGTWTLLDASPWHHYRFEDGSFLDPNTGWIIHHSGEVWRTADGGAAWTPLEVLPASLRSTVRFARQPGFTCTLTQPTRLS